MMSKWKGCVWNPRARLEIICSHHVGGKATEASAPGATLQAGSMAGPGLGRSTPAAGCLVRQPLLPPGLLGDSRRLRPARA